MGKTSKFSFPLPGRRNRFNETSESLALPEEPKLSKIERLLGTTDLPPQYQTAPSKHSLLAKQPSSLTLDMYESTIADGRSDFNASIPDLPALSNLSASFFDVEDPWVSQLSVAPPRSMTVSQGHASAPQTLDALRRNRPRSQSNNDILSIQHGKLRPSTSNGGHAYTAIQIEPKHAEIQDVVTGSRHPVRSSSHMLFPVVETNPDTVRATESYPVSGSKPGAPAAQKKRPTRLDLSKLLSRGAAASTSALRSMTSPGSASLTHNPPRFPTDVRSPSEATSPPPKLSTPRRLALKANLSSTEVYEQASVPNHTNHRYEAPIVDSQTTPSRQGNSKHWFDGLLEAEDANVPESDSDDDGSAMQDCNEWPAVRIHHQDKRMHNSRMSPRKMGSFKTAEPKSKPQEQAPQVPSAYTGAARCIRPTCSERLERIMQKQPSPLVADFPTEDLPQQDPELTTDELPDVRDSIALSEDEEAVTIGEARAFHVGSQRRNDSIETVQVTRLIQPRQLQVVSISPTKKSAPPVAPESPEAVPEMQFARHRSGSQRYAERSRSNSSSARTSLRSDQSLRGDLNHKMMAVTPEEEALLAMMRQKRAAMQSHSFAEGFKTALRSGPQSPDSRSAQHLSRNNSSHSEASLLRSPRSEAHVQRRLAEENAPLAPRPVRAQSSHVEAFLDHADTHAQSQMWAHDNADLDDALVTSPEAGHSALHSSPSVKSIHSGTQSPVTPHSASASIKIAMSSSETEPWFKLNEFADQDNLFDFSQLSASNQSLLSETAKFAEVPIAATHSLVNGHPSARSSSSHGSSHIIQQLKSSNSSSNVSRSSTRKTRPFKTRLTARSHEHRNGCCNSAVTETRCSVANDVMDAWTSLGGWQEQRSSVH